MSELCINCPYPKDVKDLRAELETVVLSDKTEHLTAVVNEQEQTIADLRAQLEAAEQHVLIVREERDSYVKYKDDQIAYHVEEQAKLQALVDALVEALEKINPYKDGECSKFGCDNAIQAALAAAARKEKE